MDDNVWNTKTPKAPSEAEPTTPVTLQPSEVRNRGTIRLVDGSLVTTVALRIIGQNLSIHRAADDSEYAALGNGFCVSLDELIAFAGSDDPLKLKAASNAFAPADSYLPEEHPSPSPGSYLAHSVYGEALRIVAKEVDSENGKELAVGDDERRWCVVENSHFLMERSEHKATYPYHYPASQLA